MGKGTARTYKNSYRIIKEFSDCMYKLDYNIITLSFYDDFMTFLIDRDLSLNYIGTQIKILKTIMNASFEKDLHQCLDFKKKYFKKPAEEVHNIYLTIEELKKIEKVDLSNFKNTRVGLNLIITRDQAERVRDLFLIGSFTGLRISDYKKLSSNNFINENGKRYLRVKSQKTEKHVTIPLHPVIKSILYRGRI
jgi:integrase